MKAPRRKFVPARLTPALRAFLDNSASGGIVLMAAAALALLVANSPLSGAYGAALHVELGGLSVLHWINDALMAVFFLMVGLEIKREMVEGQLSSWPRRILPGAAAIGGMVGPAIVYLAFNLGEAGHPKGWAIASATDIAFALGVLALVCPRVPVSLRVFLTALAIIDDLGAVIIIALFYAGDVNAVALAGAVVVTLALIGLNRIGTTRLSPYLVLGAILWFCVLQSGIHATIAGVVLAMTIPLRGKAPGDGLAPTPLATLEHALQPWVTYLIVPVFGFANAGVSFAGLSLGALADPVPLGVTLGLFIGKQVGVMVTVAALIRLRLAELPSGASWTQFYGVALLCGIGFTMSLFIGLLAFPGTPLLQDEVKLGVLLGSLLSTIAGAIVLRLSTPGPKHTAHAG